MVCIKMDWDYLIILDACRYDTFESIYREYFYGSLKKCISVASETVEWLNRVFTERYDDIIYISGNPYINSMGVKAKGFDANEHFRKIIDVWDWGWNDRIGTVHPKQVFEAALRALELYPDSRMIIHYMQPHAPYISLRVQNGEEKRKSPDLTLSSSSDFLLNILWRISKKIVGDKIKTAIRRNRTIRPSSIFGCRYMWNIKDWWSKFALGPAEVAFWVGDEGLHRAYRENLSIALGYVKELLKLLTGRVVITADHGELLGERGEYDHFPNLRVPALVEVPWFEAESVVCSE